MKRLFLYLFSEARRLKREDSGVVMAVSLAVWMFLFVLTSGVYMLGCTIRERETLQHAADAAAFSAAEIQADALARMAAINRTMAYTYMQMSRKQMDCILLEWLNLTSKRFKEDRTASKNWAQVLFITGGVPVDLITLLYQLASYTFANHGDSGDLNCDFRRRRCKDCSLLNKTRNGNAFFCGVNGNPDRVLLNGKNEVSAAHLEIGKEMIPVLKEGILADKEQIRMLNALLASVHRTACESMERTVPEILKRNLSVAFSEKEMAEIFYSAKLPNGEWNPYYATQMDAVGNESYKGMNGYFSALQNTENDERLFLGMMGEVTCADADGQADAYTLAADASVADYFKVPPSAASGGVFARLLGGSQLSSSGADQWFVRGRVNYGQTPTYVRQDGGDGLQRVYWDSNGNPAQGEFRGGGILGKGPTRANHLMDISFGGGGLIMNIIGTLVSSLGNLVDTQPSVLSVGGGQDSACDPRACRDAETAQALVADYEWWSGKWVCVTYRKRRSFPTRYYYRCQGWHVPFPKYYCGDTGDDRNARIWPKLWTWPESLDPVTKTIPDILRIPPHKTGNCHGYDDDSSMKTLPGSIRAVGRQMRLNLKRGAPIPRTEYRSCAIGFLSRKPFIGGLARIYADDREICRVRDPMTDEREEGPDIYAGACAQPWVLNERFFGSDGTITVAVAKRRRNPFARLADAFWEVDSRLPTAIGNPSGGVPGKQAYMWTMSSARAAFRQSEDAPPEIAYRHLNANGTDCLSDRVGPNESGCVCGDDATERLKHQWNLCTPYWEAVLLPTALADQYRAVDGVWREEPWVKDPNTGMSALLKLFHWDFAALPEEDEDDRSGWQSLGAAGTPPKLSAEFLEAEAPEGRGVLNLRKLYREKIL